MLECLSRPGEAFDTSSAKVWKWPLTSRPMSSSCSSAGGAWPGEAPVSAYQCRSSAGAGPSSCKLSQTLSLREKDGCFAVV